MTIASEISRLQDAKACIKAAIEEKGVTIGSDVTLDGYADCIADIPAGGGFKIAEYILVGGGGGGGSTGGGGGGAVCTGRIINDGIICVTIGSGGTRGPSQYSNGGNGGWSRLATIDASYYITALGGCGGCGANCYYGGPSGSGCAGGSGNYNAGGGGGGASANGNSYCGGAGKCGMGGGGQGYHGANESSGIDGGGYTYNCCGTNATNYGGGGGGADGGMKYYCPPGVGCQGVAFICYPLDGSCGFTTAIGGNCCYECDGYFVHKFTSNGTFCIIG